MKIDVFISHHTESSLHIVEAIVNKLESCGLRCWYAPRNTEGSYAGSIAKAINSCTTFLLILNKQSSESVHVLNELDLVTKRLAKKEKVNIIPFHTADEDISDDAQYYLGRLHWIDAMKPSMYDRINELAEQILALYGKKPLAGSPQAAMQTQASTYALVSKIPEARSVFVGREDLIARIAAFYEGGQRVLFLEGIGGIGKSELAKHYALQYRKQYKNIIFVSYTGNLLQMVCDGTGIEITGLALRPNETQAAFFTRKMQAFRTLSDEHTLLIVDNFDVDTDPYFPEFIEGSCHILITTRNAHPGYPSIQVKAMDNMPALLQLFEDNYGMPVNEEDVAYLEKLFHLVGGHTYTIELLAKQMEASFCTGKELYDMFCSGQLRNDAAEIVGRTRVDTAFGHIRTLFSMSGLQEEEKAVVRELSLFGIAGIPVSVYWRWVPQEQIAERKKAALSLIRRSWVRREQKEGGQFFALHPLVCEVVHATEEIRPDAVNCRPLLLNMEKDLFGTWDRPLKENLVFADSVCSLAAYFSPFPFEREDKALFNAWDLIPSFLWQVGRFEEAIRYGQIVYDTCKTVCGESSMFTGYAAKMQAGCYFNSGRVRESVPWYKKGLTCMLLAGECTEDLAMSYEKVARCYTWPYEQDFEKAKELFEKSLEIRKELKEQLKDGGTLETVEMDLVYDARCAEERIAETYFEIGRMYQQEGDYLTALEYTRPQEEILLKTHPGNKSGLAYVYYDRGFCHYHLALESRQQEQKEEYLRQAQEELQAALASNLHMRGTVAVDTLDNQELLGDVYQAQERKAEADNSYLAALAMAQKLFGEESERAGTIRRKME